MVYITLVRPAFAKAHQLATHLTFPRIMRSRCKPIHPRVRKLTKKMPLALKRATGRCRRALNRGHWMTGDAAWTKHWTTQLTE